MLRFVKHMTHSRVVQLVGLIVLIASIVALEGCGSTSQAQAQGTPPPMPVSVVEIRAQDVPIYGDYASQTFARDMVEVRGRVDGYVESRNFQAGTDVRAGQVLYTLDQSQYSAEVQKAKADVSQSLANLEFAKNQVALVQAEANLAQAKANLLKAQQDVDRLQPLVGQDAASQQDLDNAIPAPQANQANVAALTAN